MTRAPGAWLAWLEGRYREAQEEEEQELEAQEGKGACLGRRARMGALRRAAQRTRFATSQSWLLRCRPPPSPPLAVKHLLGRRVEAALDDLDKRLHGELTQLDRYVGEQHAAAGQRRLARAQAGWDGAAAAAPTADAQAAVLEGGVQELWVLLQLLPDFRRKTLQAQHVVLFSGQLAQEAERRRAEAERRKAEAAAAKAAAAAANGAAGGVADGAEGEAAAMEVDLTGGVQQGPAAEGPDGAAGPSSSQRQQREQQQEQQQEPAGSDGAGMAEMGAADAAAAADAERAAILQAAQGGAAFVPSGGWRGAVPGFCFKLGGSGVGYYRDAPPEVDAFLTTARVRGGCKVGERGREAGSAAVRAA